jgi:serine/threonine-protein kinase
VDELVEELLDSGGSPEDACRHCPELLPHVRATLERLRALDDKVNALFPTPTPPDGNTPVATHAPELPNVAGYDVQGVLGSGGVGIVYRAWHRRLNRPVALKMLLAGPYAQPQELERFLREAEAVASLRHPNVVQVHDVGDAGGRPYFTMELVEGGSLGAKIAGVPQAVSWAAAVVRTLAEAVQAAHQSGIVHRDLKPGNVLLTTDGVPKVTDFGLARRLEGGGGLTLTGLPLGTPSYMAPEQARGDKGAIGPATDVYALGAILYECLTGRPPFRGETQAATLLQVQADEPVPPARLNRQVPRDLETICLKCLQKAPSQRYASAAALADDLRRFEKSEPIAARPAGALERVAKWVRRRPAAAAIVAAALLMFVGISVAAVWYIGDRARQRAEAQGRGQVANAALDDAERHLKGLRAKLDDPLAVRELLSDIDHWESMVDQARQDWKRAAAAVGNEALVGEETRDRIQAVEAAVAREQAAYDLARDLDKIAVEAFGSFDQRFARQRTAVAEYERFFSQQGLDVHQPGTAWFASAIRSSPIRFALIAALDNWALLAYHYFKDPQVPRLLELTRAADPDPWRDSFRDQAVWADGTALTRLAKEVDVGRQSPTVLASLAWFLKANGADPTALYERILFDHPRDFWLHLHAVLCAEPEVRVGLTFGALTVRPRSAVAYCLLALFLQERGDLPEALVAAKRAIEIDPHYASAHLVLGLALRDKKDQPGAVAAFNRAMELDLAYGFPCWNLGDVYRLQGDRAAAVDAYCKAADREGTAGAFRKLGGRLRDLQDQPGAVAAFKRATELYQRGIELDGGSSQARHDLGQVLQQQGRYAEAEQAYLGAIKAQPDCVPAHNSLARLLATCPDDKARDGKRALEYARRACERTGEKDPLCLDTLAAAYAEAGQFEEAIRYQARALESPALKGEFRTAARQRLELYLHKKPFRDQGP